VEKAHIALTFWGFIGGLAYPAGTMLLGALVQSLGYRTGYFIYSLLVFIPLLIDAKIWHLLKNKISRRRKLITKSKQNYGSCHLTLVPVSTTK